MSGASGKVPAAIHVTPEAADGGPIASLRDGDIIRIDPETGTLEVRVDAREFESRKPERFSQQSWGLGRELFAPFRAHVGPADKGASIFGREP